MARVERRTIGERAERSASPGTRFSAPSVSEALWAYRDAMNDGASPHELIDALYAGLNAIDLARLKGLFLPAATIVRVVTPMTVHTVDSWSSGLASVFTANEELELSRRVDQHGALAQVLSRFVIRDRVTKAPLRSGTNAFSLVHDGSRWWLASATWVLDA